MTPQEPQPEIKDYRPKLSAKTRDALMELAAALAFVIDQPGRYDGTPSVRDLLESLAAAYEQDPVAVKLAFRVLGVTANSLPDDVRYTSEPEDAAGGGAMSLSGNLTARVIRKDDSE